jgi:phage terminase large subunit-like protein
MPTIPEILLGRDPAERERLIRLLPDELVQAANRAFPEWAHDGQLAPAGDWRTWVLMAGRGFGKTRAGAEWVLG